MALVASGSKISKSEIELADALRDFEGILSEEQKQNFHSSGHPSAHAAIELATQVDQECNAKRRQCMGSRVLLFVQSLEQVYGTVDTFVSSNPQVAALVWGSVKVTILAASNIISYFDKVSTLFMDIGRQCRIMDSLGFSYPSDGLQRNRCEYSLAVLRLCKHVLTFLTRSVYKQWSHALFVSFKAEFGCYEQEFAQISQTIRDEAFLAQSDFHKKEAELQAKERSRNETGRVGLKKLRQSFDRSNEKRESEISLIQGWRRENKKAKFLKTLSTHDYQTPFRRLRRDRALGTCEWIFEQQDFKMWLDGPSTTFWLMGRLGSGKSINSASIVTHLVSVCLLRDIVCYFFCRFDHEDSLNAQSVIGSILQQMVRHLPAEKFQGYEIDGDSDQSSVAFAERLLDGNRRYLVILDGIDDMKEEQMEQVLEFLEEIPLRSDLTVKIFVSSRPNAPKWLQTKLIPSYKLDMNHGEVARQVAQDIEAFIDVQLEYWLDEEKPDFVGDPRHILKIRDTLNEKADGMFLWVHLQIQTLVRKHSDEEILNGLNDVPKDLPDTFDRLLAPHGDGQPNAVRKRIFDWVTVAKRPLELKEFREAISMKPLQSAREPQKLVNDVRKAIADCNNLVVIDEELCTVHFTHSSIKQYLLRKDLEGTSYQNCVDYGDADAAAGAICVTYLNFPQFERRIVKAQKSIEASNLTSAVVTETLKLKGPSNRIALRLLKSRKQVDKPLNQVFKTAEVDEENEESPLLSYALEFWIHHTSRGIKERSEDLWRLWCNLVEVADSRQTLSGVAWTSKDLNDGSPLIANWIVKHYHYPWAHFVISHLGEHTGFKYATYLTWTSVLRADIEFIDFCLVYNSRILGNTLSFGLVSAVLTNQWDVAERLRSISHVQEATLHRHVWQILFGWNWEIFKIDNADCRTFPNDDQCINRVTSLFEVIAYSFAGLSLLAAAASELGPPGLFQTLLRHGWHVDQRNREGSTALTQAAEYGLDAGVRELLHNDAHIDHLDSEGRTALILAASHGNGSVVRILCDAGADVDIEDKYGSTALFGAAQCGDDLGVSQLLVHGARIDHRDSTGVSALIFAASLKYESTVRILLDAGAAVDLEAVHKEAISERLRSEPAIMMHDWLSGRRLYVEVPDPWTTAEKTLKVAGVRE